MAQRDRNGEQALGVACDELTKEYEHGFNAAQLGWRWIEVMSWEAHYRIPPNQIEEMANV